MSTLYDQVLKTNIYIQPLLFTLMVVTNSLTIRVLCSRTLRSSPCCYYFLGYAINSIIYSCLVCPTQFIRALLIGWENTSVGCNIYFFALFTPPCIARAMLVLASFDRYCSSSTSRRLHSTSTQRKARITIIIAVVLVATYMTPMFAIYYFNKATGTCVQHSNLPITIYVFSQMIAYYTLAPLLLIVFGILTIINIRQHAAIRIAPQNPPVRGRRTEYQLARMLLLQVFVHIVLTTPFGIVYFINTLNPSSRTPNIIALRYIFLICSQADYFLSFFLYISTGSIFREQLCQLFRFTKQQTSPKCNKPTT